MSFHFPQHRISLTRRSFVRIGSLSAFGIGLSHFLARSTSAAPAPAKAKRCILIWLDGGPSHLETFDLKPDAPQEVRGPLQPISTSVPGIQICESLPNLASRIEHAAIIRSLTSPLGEHNLGTNYMLTGYPPTPSLEYPAIGSVVAHLDGEPRTLPKFVAVPNHGVGGQRMNASGYLPKSVRPFELGSDPARPDFRVQDLDFYPGLDGERIDRRRQYLEALDRFSRGVEGTLRVPSDDNGTRSVPTTKPLAAAYRLIASPAAKAAFDLNKESSATRAKYGPRTVGQSTLAARRLVEAGVPFVTINYPGWDTHQNLYTQLKEGYTGAKEPVGLVPMLDLALSALLDDLADRGMLAETLVIVMGEFGRTPKLNTQGGRDHWPRVFSVLLAGGGVPGGQVIGASDATGESPQDRPITPADLAATIFTLLGIDPRQTLHTADGRPVQINRDGQVVKELAG